ncbi:MAG TPA: TonB family protein [Blastocatellia bacterium]|nr:TonB family protein [Blastocatellia bacterium]
MRLSLRDISIKILFLFFIFNLPSVVWAQANPEPLFKEVRPAVVLITSYDKKGIPLIRGTGFFISTMGEVLTRRRLLPTGTNRSEVKTFDDKVYRVIGIMTEDNKTDLVKLLVDIPAERVKPLTNRGRTPEANELVFVITAGGEQEYIKGTVSAIEESSLGSVMRINAMIAPTSNGSPVVNTKGELVGVALFMKPGEPTFIANTAESLAAVMPVVPAEMANITKPKLLNTVRPNYTEQARQKRIEGSVYMKVLIGENGEVEKAQVVRGLPEGLTEQALKAVFKLKFDPAKKEGKPIKFWVPIIIEFQLGY